MKLQLFENGVIDVVTLKIKSTILFTAAKEIRTLKDREGITSNICPVSALREYLEHTSNQNEGCQFINPKNNKSISLFSVKISDMLTNNRSRSSNKS